MSRIRLVQPEAWPVEWRGSWRHVYVVQEGEAGPIKIGVAANAFWRRHDLQTGNPRELFLRAVFHVDNKHVAREIEKAVHIALGYAKISGEWFDCEPSEAVSLIEREGLPE